MPGLYEAIVLIRLVQLDNRAIEIGQIICFRDDTMVTGGETFPESGLYESRFTSADWVVPFQGPAGSLDPPEDPCPACDSTHCVSWWDHRDPCLRDDPIPFDPYAQIKSVEWDDGGQRWLAYDAKGSFVLSLTDRGVRALSRQSSLGGGCLDCHGGTATNAHTCGPCQGSGVINPQ